MKLAQITTAMACLLAVGLAAGTHAASPAPLQAGSHAPSGLPVVLVELFTSEGCSSCPPADRLLQQLNGMQTEQGQLVVGISEHVTYWNSLGWTDPFSNDAYTQRQNGYGRRLGLDEIYTPQMVVNGRQQLVGSDARALEKAFAKASQEHPVELRILSAERAGDALHVRFAAGAAPAGEPVDVVAVIADDVDSSHVLRGENASRTLQHVAVARSLERVAMLGASAEKSVDIRLPQSALANSHAGHHVILFAQTEGYGPVLGADSRAF